MSRDRRISVMAESVMDLVLEWLALVFFRRRKKELE
jgi:hypothetical protein